MERPPSPRPTPRRSRAKPSPPKPPAHPTPARPTPPEGGKSFAAIAPSSVSPEPSRRARPARLASPRRGRHNPPHPSSLYPLRLANTPRRGKSSAAIAPSSVHHQTLPLRPPSLACIPHRGRHNTSHPSSLYPLRPANAPPKGEVFRRYCAKPRPPPNPPAAPAPPGQHSPQGEGIDRPTPPTISTPPRLRPPKGEVIRRYCAKLRLPKTLPLRPLSPACIPPQGKA